MTDVWFVLALVAFFVVSVGFVKVCERIIGPDPVVDEPEEMSA